MGRKKIHFNDKNHVVYKHGAQSGEMWHDGRDRLEVVFSVDNVSNIKRQAWVVGS